MNVEQHGASRPDLDRRVALHAALADPTRLRVVDLLALGDASSSELGAALGVPSNLLAHHLRALEEVGLVERQQSEGDRRRTYWRLRATAVDTLAPRALRRPRRLVFVCTANSARSHLAAALWTRASDVPAASAGTRPAERVDPGAVAAARRRGVPLPAGATPRTLAEVEQEGDLLVTVCDLAHEQLGASLADRATLHWSVPDPVKVGTDAAFDHALDVLAERVEALAPQLEAAS